VPHCLNFAQLVGNPDPYGLLLYAAHGLSFNFSSSNKKKKKISIPKHVLSFHIYCLIVQAKKIRNIESLEK